MAAHPVVEQTVTDQMCDALRRLQTVRSFDYDRAYAVAYEGCSGLRHAHVSDIAGAFFSGRSLALDLVKTNWAIHHNRVGAVA